jgi:DNA-binding GntR family transcriptional regulator
VKRNDHPSIARGASGPARRTGGSSSLLDEAYDAIKHRITICAFRPGEYLNEAEISVTLGIGRTPVHQALDRLMIEGLVEVMPRKGVMVKPVSLEDVLQTIEVRLLNEVHGVRLAADRASATDIKQMSATLDRAAKELPSRNVEQLMLLDQEFHGLIAIASRNLVLSNVLGRLHDRSLRFWVISLTAAGHHAAVHEQHVAILDAIRAHDADSAAAAMRHHIEAFRQNLMKSV